MVKITPESIRKYLKNRYPEFTERKLNNEVKKQVEYVNKVLNTSPVKEATITVDWNNNKTWGMCPKATVKYITKDGKYHTMESRRITGAGFDKQSSAIGEVFSVILLPNLINKRTISNIPHIYNSKDGYHLPVIDISTAGMGAVQSFVKALSGTWKQVTETPNVDVYTMTFR